MHAELPFSMSIRVYWEDTDAGGVVYHASYVRFLERVRTELLRVCGIAQERLQAEHDVLFAIRSMQVDFHRPARLDDLLDVRVESVDVGRASLVFAQRIVSADGETLIAATVKAACLTASTFRPRPIPADLRARFVAAWSDSPIRSVDSRTFGVVR